MARTDESLYTGITSVTAREQDAKKKQKQDIAQSDAASNKKELDRLVTLIESSRAKIPTRIWELTGIETPEADIKSVLIALKLLDTELANFEAEARIALNRSKG